MYSPHLSLGLKLSLDSVGDRRSISIESAITRKGYTQELGGEKFEIDFTYFNVQATYNYSIVPAVALKGGLNFAFMPDKAENPMKEAYRAVDIGLVATLSVFENKRLGFYTSCVYGLIPVLRYYNIDAVGNFNGKINDLRNTCFMVGLRYNLDERKIKN